MSSLNLFHCPGACSRVVLNALEEAGVPFEERPVNIFRGEQRSPELLAVNPKGKVPALLVDGTLLTENASILLYLHETYPQATLLPPATDALARAAQRSDLMWIASTLHPMVRTMVMPDRVSVQDADGVRAGATAQFAPIAAAIDARLQANTWWYGDAWSIVDVYLYWALSMAAIGRFDLTPLPSILAHAGRVRARDSFRRALAREQAAVDSGKITPPPSSSL